MRIILISSILLRNLSFLDETSKSKEDEGKTLKAKMQLAQVIKEMSVARRKSRYEALIPWDQIQIEGYTTPQLQEMLKEIVKTVGKNRSLHEVMTQYKSNHWTYDRKMNSSYPKHPVAPPCVYYHENYAELKEEYKQKFGWRDGEVK